MKFSTKTTGFEGLEDALIELEQFSGRTTAGKNAVQRGMKSAMKRVENKAKSLVPVDEGDLRDSITTKKERAKRQRGSAKFARQTGISMLTGPTGKPEGGNPAWQEEGTVKMTPQPYMRPAADSEGQKVIADVAKELQDAVMKSVARARKKAARGK
jgi:HK97 gp10 family phage protein